MFTCTNCVQVTFDPQSTHPYMDMLEFDCRGSSTDTRGGHAVTVGVPPVAGAAIVFDSVLGLPDPLEGATSGDISRLCMHAFINGVSSRDNKHVAPAHACACA